MDSMLCCKKCYQDLINKFDEETANLWMAMCSHFVQYEGDFRVRESRIPWIIKNLTRLEKADFIATCDNFDAIMVRVHGYSVIDTADGAIEMFCNDVEHEPGIDIQDVQCV